MAEISNKTLAVLLIVAIVVSVGGAMVNIAKLAELTRVVPLLQITGMPTAGTVNITISSQVSINLTQYEIDFGPGYVTAGSDAARLNTSSGWRGKENWSNATTFLPSNFTIENVGNRNASLNFTSDKPAGSFIGGGAGTIPDPSFMFRGVNKDAGTCSSTGAGGFNLTTAYTEVIIGDFALGWGNDLCKCMRFEDSNDELFMNAQVIIPQDAAPGGKNATLTFTATDWGVTNKVC